jgi:hypothetical protein
MATTSKYFVPIDAEFIILGKKTTFKSILFQKNKVVFSKKFNLFSKNKKEQDVFSPCENVYLASYVLTMSKLKTRPQNWAVLTCNVTPKSYIDFTAFRCFPSVRNCSRIEMKGTKVFLVFSCVLSNDNTKYFKSYTTCLKFLKMHLFLYQNQKFVVLIYFTKQTLEINLKR